MFPTTKNMFKRQKNVKAPLQDNFLKDFFIFLNYTRKSKQSPLAVQDDCHPLCSDTYLPSCLAAPSRSPAHETE
jgi:hypothetical protein